MHVVKWSNIFSKSCGVNTARFLKYVWPFDNIMHERVKELLTKGEVQQPAPGFSFSFSLEFCISVQFWFLHFQIIFRVQFICFFFEVPNQDKCSVYIILQICLLLLSPFTINKFQCKILNVLKHLRSDLIKIECFTKFFHLLKRHPVLHFLFPHSGFCLIWFYFIIFYKDQRYFIKCFIEIFYSMQFIVF